MSFSQSVKSFGPSTISGLLHVIPSLLSTRARLFLGRHENHIRYVSPSLRTEMSKQVPRSPPSTGFLANFTQPAAVSVGICEFSPAWAAFQRSTTSMRGGKDDFMASALRLVRSHWLRWGRSIFALPIFPIPVGLLSHDRGRIARPWRLLAGRNRSLDSIARPRGRAEMALGNPFQRL